MSAHTPSAGNSPRPPRSAEPIKPDIIETWLGGTDVGAATKRLYRLGMQTFLDYVATRQLDFDRLEQDDVVAFKRMLEQKGLAPATVSCYLCGVRSFFRWSDSTAIPDIARSVKGAKVSHAFKKDILSPQQARDLLTAIDASTLQGKRDYAIINLMLRTGLRDIEIVRADIDDIHRKASYALLQIMGKGRQEKDDVVVLSDEALAPITAYLDARKEDDPLAFGTQPCPLFVSHANRNRNGRLTTRTISGIVKTRLRAIGIDSDRYTAHSLRHSAITYSLLGGATVQEAKEMARHGNIETTMVYAHNIDRIQNAAEGKIGSVLDAE